MADKLVSIVMPVLNEEKYIAAAIESIVQGISDLNYEILVADGGSHDRTRAVVEDYSRRNSRIKLLNNPRRLQSAAVNLAAEAADPNADILVRADGHAIYPPGFVATCVRRLRATGAQSVVVTMRTVGRTWFQRGAAAAQNSLLGTGGAAHRRMGDSRYVDHGHHAAFDRAFYRAVGGYDETMVANEDVDLDMRIARAGGRIWLETSVPVTYFPRSTVRALARQYFNYGRGRAISFLRHRYRLKLRQLVPVGVLSANSGAILLGAAVNPLFLAIPALYLALCLGWGTADAVRRREAGLAFSTGIAAIVMHHAWAIGFTTGMCSSRFAGGDASSQSHKKFR